MRLETAAAGKGSKLPALEDEAAIAAGDVHICGSGEGESLVFNATAIFKGTGDCGADF